MNKIKWFRSPRKLNTLPVRSVVQFDQSWDRWTKGDDGKWVSNNIPFTAESMVHYNNGRVFQVISMGDES